MFFYGASISAVTERRVHGSRKKCPFSCRLNNPLLMSGCAPVPKRFPHEVPRLQKFCCCRPNCWVFAPPHKSQCQLTAESAECCRKRDSSHLPGREAPAWTATGEPRHSTLLVLYTSSTKILCHWEVLDGTEKDDQVWKIWRRKSSEHSDNPGSPRKWAL